MGQLSREVQVLLGIPVAELRRSTYFKENLWPSWFRPRHGWNFLCRVAGFRHLCVRLFLTPNTITDYQQALLFVVELVGKSPAAVVKSFQKECLWWNETGISLVCRRLVPPIQAVPLLLQVKTLPLSNVAFTGELRDQRLHQWTWCGSPSETHALLRGHSLLFDLQEVTRPNHTHLRVQTPPGLRRIRSANLMGQHPQPVLQRSPPV